MLQSKAFWCFVFLAAIIAGSLASSAQAVPVNFVLDPVESRINIAGAFGAAPLVAQDAPANTSLRTSYSGSILVDVDNPLAPTTIQFLSASAVAANSGDWLPAVGGGTTGPAGDGNADPGAAAPANYGLFLNLGALGQAYAAMRDFSLSINGGPQAVAVGSFASTQTFDVTSGIFDVNVSSVAFGDAASSDSVAGAMAVSTHPMNGTYSVAGNVATLSVRPLITFAGDVTLQFSGRLVGKAIVVPEPASCVLSGFGVLLLLGIASRRRKLQI